jgi:hypothetical protein
MDEQTLFKILTQFYLKVVKPDLDELREEMNVFKAGTYDRMDKVIGELKVTREEQAIMNYRLDNIEATPTVAHELKKKKS